VVVFVPDPAVARWYREQLAVDLLSSVRLLPRLFSTLDVPLVSDLSLAVARPAAVLFSAACHLEDTKIDEMFPALLAALATLEPARRIFYDDQTVGRLPAAARARWKEFLMTKAPGKRWYRDDLNQADAEGEARGEAKGEAKSVLLVLESRGVPVPDSFRQQVMACTDTGQLERWLRQAVTATTVDDVTTTGGATSGGLVVAGAQ
jgi:hypothetical protein